MTRPTDVGSQSGGGNGSDDGIEPRRVESGLDEERDQSTPQPGELLRAEDGDVQFARELETRLEHNIQLLERLRKPFVLYWMKALDRSGQLNELLAGLCRQEDIICVNAAGEFVALLTGTTREGVLGFEGRLDEQLGERVAPPQVQRGYRTYGPDDAAQKRRTQPLSLETKIELHRR
jgi:hypothetical protein